MSGRQQAPAPKQASKKKPSKNNNNPSSNNSKKRKAPAEDDDELTTKTTTGPSSSSNKKPKTKKNPTAQDATLDALLDLDHNVNTIFATMDPDLLADYVAAQTKRFGGDDLSLVELSDLYVPAGAIRDTTTGNNKKPRTKENLADFLEANVGGEDTEKEKKRLGTAPKDRGAPHTIIVTGAGLRAADLVRATRTFQKKDNVVAKLVSNCPLPTYPPPLPYREDDFLYLRGIRVLLRA